LEEVEAVAGAALPKLSARELAAIFAGGVIGALARAGLAQLAPPRPGTWPWTTFAANITGALLLGYFVTGCRSACRCRPTGARCWAPVCAAR
jgi:fluoride ion exporter CrcB/FEX